MLEKASKIIERVKQETDSVLLMHSLSGKDSITLLDLLHPHFKQIVCVYMYIVPDLDHIKPYWRSAYMRYNNIKFVQIPHYALFEYIKNGFMGCKQNAKQKLYTLSDLVDKIRVDIGVEWACMGFKQTDSLNRLLMLRGYDMQGINYKTKKFYPLSEYSNKEVLAYIRQNRLIQPETYGGRGQSTGTDIASPYYLRYLQKYYPADLEKIFAQFPMTRGILAGV
jgi:sulfate adenylyltransferase subunit 2